MSDNPVITLLERVSQRSASAAQRLRVRSAVNPMLWACGIVSLPVFLLAYFVRSDRELTKVLEFVGSLPVMAAVLGFFYFAIRHPEKLQSEEYQIRHEALEIIKQKGSALELLPSSVEAISNPAITPLPSAGME